MHEQRPRARREQTEGQTVQRSFTRSRTRKDCHGAECRALMRSGLWWRLPGGGGCGLVEGWEARGKPGKRPVSSPGHRGMFGCLHQAPLGDQRQETAKGNLARGSRSPPSRASPWLLLKLKSGHRGPSGPSVFLACFSQPPGFLPLSLLHLFSMWQ